VVRFISISSVYRFKRPLPLQRDYLFDFVPFEFLPFDFVPFDFVPFDFLWFEVDRVRSPSLVVSQGFSGYRTLVRPKLRLAPAGAFSVAPDPLPNRSSRGFAGAGKVAGRTIDQNELEAIAPEPWHVALEKYERLWRIPR
jgi:hypothetical protein